jgi:CheY-like chemotaxis protein
MMNGGIQVCSEEGRGSTFEFTVMMDKDTAYEDEHEVHDLSAYRLLLFDIHPATRQSWRLCLQDTGIHIDEAGTPSELIASITNKQAQGTPYDLVLLDCEYPGFPPEEINRLLNGLSVKMITVVALGSLVDPHKLAIPEQKGFLTKPIKRINLLRKVMIALDLEEVKSTAHFSSIIVPTIPQRILMAEDVKVNVMVAAGLLHSMGHELDTAENGLAALDMLRNNDYDLVLMDCQMPVMDGYQCTEAIRSGTSGVRNPQIPIIAMTAYAMSGDREKCLAAGMNDYVSKPIEAKLLAKAISKWGRKK